MAKTQKGLLLNNDLLRLVAQVERSTGVNFTRIVTAALLQYLFSDPDGPDANWMEYAVQLETGETDVADIPLQRANDETADALADVQCLESMEGMSEIAITEARYRVTQARQAFAQWQRMARQNEEGVEKVIAHWEERLRQRRMKTITPETHPELFKSDDTAADSKPDTK